MSEFRVTHANGLSEGESVWFALTLEDVDDPAHTHRLDLGFTDRTNIREVTEFFTTARAFGLGRDFWSGDPSTQEIADALVGKIVKGDHGSV